MMAFVMERLMWRAMPVVAFLAIVLAVNSDHPKLLGYKLYPSITRSQQINANLAFSVIGLFYAMYWLNANRAARKERQKKRAEDKAAKAAAVARIRDKRAERGRTQKSGGGAKRKRPDPLHRSGH